MRHCLVKRRRSPDLSPSAITSSAEPKVNKPVALQWRKATGARGPRAEAPSQARSTNTHLSHHHIMDSWKEQARVLRGASHTHPPSGGAHRRHAVSPSGPALENSHRPQGPRKSQSHTDCSLRSNITTNHALTSHNSIQQNNNDHERRTWQRAIQAGEEVIGSAISVSGL
jgi:hypothetical protein